MKIYGKFLFFDNRTGEHVINTLHGTVCVDNIHELFHRYAKDLGVRAFTANDDDLEVSLKWELQGKWYTTAQIERILKLKAFL